jgi:hypothetical protein
MELVPGDQVLAECRVGFAKQDEDGFDAGSDGLLEPAYVCDIKVDVIVIIDAVGHQCKVVIFIKDALVEGLAEGACELWVPLAMQRAAPLDLVKDTWCFPPGWCQRRVARLRQIGCGRQPPSWLGAKGKANLEEQIVDKDVREGTSHIWVELDLLEA